MSKSKLDPLTHDFYERYVRFSEILHNSWIDFYVQDEVVKIVENQCKNEPYNSSIIATTTSPVNNGQRTHARIRGRNLAGIGRRVFKHDMPVSILLNAVGLFEALISDVAKVAYMSDPKRFLLREHKGTGDQENVGERGNVKLLTILIDSSTREEAIEKYAEERLRGIFYGNPSDLFEKNKLGFDLDKSIPQTCQNEINQFKEITARRNVIVHNLSRIDNKYIREIVGTPLKLGDQVAVDATYLFEALKTMDVLAVNYVNCVSMSTVQKSLPSARTAHIRATSNSKKATI